ncbi:unnamed protein product, partial [Rotaria sp. Silwood1]
MDVNSLNPQTILYKADPIMENYFQAAIGSKSNSLVLEKRSENITEMNKYVWQKRMNRLYTYTDIYLGFQIPTPQEDTYKIQTLSSNLISGHEVISVASNIFFKYVLNDTKPTLSSLLNVLSIGSCFLKIIPTSLILDVFVFYLIFLYTTIFLVSERKDGLLSLLNISSL